MNKSDITTIQSELNNIASELVNFSSSVFSLSIESDNTLIAKFNNNAVSWINLGVLYKQNRIDTDIAKLFVVNCFSR